MSTSMGRIGYWWGEKKSRKFNVQKFHEVCKQSGLELMKIDLDQPLNEQGPFIAIVHKLSDAIVKAKQGDFQSQQVCQAFHDYVKENPELIMIDPLPNVEKLLDRYQQYKLVENSDVQTQGVVFTPAFVEFSTSNVEENLAKMKSAGVTFPCVCKPTLAHGSVLAHKLCLVFNEEGLKDVSPPCVAQKFINHNAILYKLFIAGDKYFIIERPSLKNFYAGDYETIFFDSNDISKPNSVSVLTELDENEQKMPIFFPEKRIIDQIVEVVSERLQMALFGVDVIIDNSTGSYAIIDMNVFPGYDEVENFFQIVVDMILNRVSLKHNGPQIWKPKLDGAFLLHNWKCNTNLLEFNCKGMLQNGVNDRAFQCFCCPVNSQFCNATESTLEIKNDDDCNLDALFQNLAKNNERTIVPEQNLDSCDLLENTQEDSGIETSDSCDEKKNGTNLRTVKRHSRNYTISTNNAFKLKTNSS